jgi:hypothetical protein
MLWSAVNRVIRVRQTDWDRGSNSLAFLSSPRKRYVLIAQYKEVRMRRVQAVAIGSWLSLMLVACPGSTPTPGGKPVLQSTQPNNLVECPVRAGDWMGLKGENFGTVDDWKAGKNKVIFADKVPATTVELTQVSGPATLILRVPDGAKSGNMVVEVGGVASDPYAVAIQPATQVRSQIAVPVCDRPTPP